MNQSMTDLMTASAYNVYAIRNRDESRREYQDRRQRELITQAMTELCTAQAWISRANKARARGDYAMADFITKTQLV
jgi:hypothetical protein